MPQLFDSYIAVDWSASSKPKSGRDSIWWFELRDGSHLSQNPRTREQAYGDILEILRSNVRQRRRVLIGFDFPYGYPRGWATRLELDGPPWSAIWREIGNEIRDDNRNKNNRFAVAAKLNNRTSGKPYPFWGCLERERCETLDSYRHHWLARSDLSELRCCEKYCHGQSAWKLWGAGCVGSQALLGIPRVWSLLNDPELRRFSKVWPFETGFQVPHAVPGKPVVVHAEIYPSLIETKLKPSEVKDEAQVRSLCEHFRKLDMAGRLGEFFEAPPDMSTNERRYVEQEEGWILGISKTGNAQ